MSNNEGKRAFPFFKPDLTEKSSKNSPINLTLHLESYIRAFTSITSFEGFQVDSLLSRAYID